MTNATKCVGLLFPGSMGGAIGAALARTNIRVITVLEGRSDETCNRVKEAGIEDAKNLDQLTLEADIILSILPPGIALETAEEVAKAMGRTNKFPTYADCNAISPETAQKIADIFANTDASFIDACIIGLPPPEHEPRIYASGEAASELAFMDGHEMKIVDLQASCGAASATKMIYASVSKGTISLVATAMLAAQQHGVVDTIMAEFDSSQSHVANVARTWITRLPADAARWADEMDEISATFGKIGLSPNLHKGAGDLMRLFAASPFANETRQTRDVSRTMEQTLVTVSQQLKPRNNDN